MTTHHLSRSRWAAIGAAVAVTLGAGGLISVNAANDTSSLVPVTPARILDTRSGNRVGSLDTAGASDPYRLKVIGTDGIPTSGVTAVSLNVTAVDTQTNDYGGYVSVYPCAAVSSVKPDVSHINFGSGQTIANAVTVPISTDGHICLYVYGTAHLLVDVNGYYTQASTATGEQGPQGERGPAGPVNRITNEQIATLAWYDDPGRAAVIAVGDRPYVIAFDGTNIYVANSSGNTVSVIEPATNTVTTTINVGSQPSGIAFDGTNIYVANFSGNTVSVIEPATNTVTATINVGSEPSGIAFDGTNIYVANFSGNTVSVIDPATKTVIGSPIAVGDAPNGIAFDGTNIYVTNVSDNTVSVIDPATKTVIGSPIAVGNAPNFIAFDGTNIYVTNLEDNTVSVIDPATKTVIGSPIAVDGPYGIAFDGTNIYVTNYDDDTVTKLPPQ